MDALSAQRCAYCRCPAQGNYSIHRDGLGVGPEVPLCDGCGGQELPSLGAIWARIGQSPECVRCDDEIRPGDERVGSFHSWCFEEASNG